MKHAVASLEGALLDAAVAKAEMRVYSLDDWKWADFAPSAKWEHGGPIIEREQIDVSWSDTEYLKTALACKAIYWPPEDDDKVHIVIYGPTPLIAAMRALVASKFGEEVDLP